MPHKRGTAAQKEIAAGVATMLMEHQDGILVSKPGTGKSIMAGYVYKKLDEQHDDALVFHIAATPQEALAQCEDVRAYDKRPFGSGQVKKLCAHFETKHGATVTTVTATGMKGLLKAAVEAPDEAKVYAKPETVGKLAKKSVLWEVLQKADKAGIAIVVLAFDECHAAYKTTKPTVPKYVAKLREMVVHQFQHRVAS